MRNKVVIDTNVILTANGQHDGASPSCKDSCSKSLFEAMNSSIVVIDDGYEVLKEYQHKTSPWKGNAAGDMFLKWLINNSNNPRCCKQVRITLEKQTNTYNEFPDQALQDDFDPPDRKFVAVAGADGCEPNILQAVDCKWLNWNVRLKAAGIEVKYICPDDICRFYANKYPDQPIPEF
jgi:predicted nucleic acid-binding protein